jgi:hypothetical protein
MWSLDDVGASTTSSRETVALEKRTHPGFQEGAPKERARETSRDVTGSRPPARCPMRPRLRPQQRIRCIVVRGVGLWRHLQHPAERHPLPDRADEARKDR